MRDLYTVLKETGLQYSPKRGTNLLNLIEDLESQENINDQIVLDTFVEFNSTMQSNCDSVAQGLLACVISICVYKPHLEVELLVAPLQALYYLGIEDLDDLKHYLKWFITYQDPYLGRAPDKAYEWFGDFLKDNDQVIIEAFRKMYFKEDNEWRESEPQILTQPI